MDNFYRENILDHYKNPRNFGKPNNFAYSSETSNPLCGDRIGMAVKLKDNTIKDINFWGEGCAICLAAASMLTSDVIGKTLAEVKKIGKEKMLEFLGIELTPTRLKCALLPLEALHKTIAQFDKTRGQS